MSILTSRVGQVLKVQSGTLWTRGIVGRGHHISMANLFNKPRIVASFSSPLTAMHQKEIQHESYGLSNTQQKRYIKKEISKALVLVKDLKHLTSSPAPALTLGLSGLVPFVTIPAYMIMSGGFIEGLAFSQIAYGACILSFVGAVRWGTALSDQEVVTANWFNLGYSVAPSLVAWTALMLPQSLGMLVLMGGLAGTAYMDLTMFGYPAWFKALRFLLSLVAVLSLWTTLLCSFTLSEGRKKKKEKAKKKEAEKKAPEPEVVVPKEVKTEGDGGDAVVAVESPSA